MNKKKLTPDEEKFCLLYACGPAPYNGNAKQTFDLVFNKRTGRYYSPVPRKAKDNAKDEAFNPDQLELDSVEASLSAHSLMARDEIKDRIDELKSQSIIDAATLRPRLTAQLLKIADECSTLTVEDRWGTPLSPAALRSVAVNAISKLTDMYGIKEDIAHKVQVESAGGEGITFNLVMPQSNKENELGAIIE